MVNPTPPPGPVIWIHNEKPTYDVVAVVLGAFQATSVLVLGALLIGGLIGTWLILVRRRDTASVLDPVSLHLDREPKTSSLPVA